MPAKRTIALLGALVCALIGAVTWALAFRTGLGQAADARVLDGLSAYQYTRLGPLAVAVGALGNPLPYAAMCAAAVALALALRGPWTALIVARCSSSQRRHADPQARAGREPGRRRRRPGGRPRVVAERPLDRGGGLALAVAADRAGRAGAPLVGLVGAAFAAAMAGVRRPARLALPERRRRRLRGGRRRGVPGGGAAQPPGCHSGSSEPLAPRDRMKSRSESRLR